MTLRVNVQHWIPAYAGMTPLLGRSLEKRSASRQIDTSLHAARNPGRALLLRATAALLCALVVTVVPGTGFAAPSFLLSTPNASGEWLAAGANQDFIAANLERIDVLVQDRDRDGLTDFVSVTGVYKTPGRFFSVVFASNRIPQPLTVGSYTNAERAAFASTGRPGLDIGINGTGCNTLAGSFDVLSLRESSAQQLSYLDVTFLFRCDGNGTPLAGRFIFDITGAPIQLQPAQMPAPIPAISSAGLLLLGLCVALVVTGGGILNARSR